MGPNSTGSMNLPVALRLGRVSNLPTVWSNVLAGIALAGGSTWDLRVIPLLLALSLFYTAGMFLNDAFDRRIDAIERPDRPIPRHEVTAKTVFVTGMVMLGGGILILAGLGHLSSQGTGFMPVLAGLVLSGLILLYNWHHKKNPLSPLIMGACRMMIYVTVGLTVSVGPSPEMLWGGLILLCWLIGLTFIAKQETLGSVTNFWPVGILAIPFVYCFPYTLKDFLAALIWVGMVILVVFVLFLLQRRKAGDVGLSVATLIAGISLLDALFILKWGDQVSALLAIAAFPLTLVLQRVVPGT